MNAAAATQQMVDMFDIKGIIHFGIAGNVNNSMSIGDVTIPEQFAHTGIWDWMVPFYSSFSFSLTYFTHYLVMKEENGRKIFMFLFFYLWLDKKTTNEE